MDNTGIIAQSAMKLLIVFALLFLSCPVQAQDTAVIRVRKETQTTERRNYYCLQAKSNDSIWKVITLYYKSINRNPDTTTLIFSGNRSSVCIISRNDTGYTDLAVHQENRLEFWHNGFRYYFSCDSRGTSFVSHGSHGDTSGALYDLGSYLVGYLRVFRKEN